MKIKKSIYKMSSSERIGELKIDSTLWAIPAKKINLLDFDPKKISIDTELNSINNTTDASSKHLIDIHEVRYDDGGFYLVIDDIKGYFNLDDNTSGILDMILTDCFYHVTYEFESESTLYSCLNVKELLARSRRHI